MISLKFCVLHAQPSESLNALSRPGPGAARPVRNRLERICAKRVVHTAMQSSPGFPCCLARSTICLARLSSIRRTSATPACSALSRCHSLSTNSTSAASGDLKSPESVDDGSIDGSMMVLGESPAPVMEPDSPVAEPDSPVMEPDSPVSNSWGESPAPVVRPGPSKLSFNRRMRSQCGRASMLKT